MWGGEKRREMERDKERERLRGIKLRREAEREFYIHGFAPPS